MSSGVIERAESNKPVGEKNVGEQFCSECGAKKVVNKNMKENPFFGFLKEVKVRTAVFVERCLKSTAPFYILVVLGFILNCILSKTELEGFSVNLMAINLSQLSLELSFLITILVTVWISLLLVFHFINIYAYVGWFFNWLSSVAFAQFVISIAMFLYLESSAMLDYNLQSIARLNLMSLLILMIISVHMDALKERSSGFSFTLLTNLVWIGVYLVVYFCFSDQLYKFKWVAAASVLFAVGLVCWRGRDGRGLKRFEEITYSFAYGGVVLVMDWYFHYGLETLLKN